METIYAQIAARTGGNIYVGVVGPVRTGKSTLIKRIMEQLVLPGIEDPYRRERARDELPQSGSGKTIMTSEPKFVPEEAVEISPDGAVKLRVRMIDSVGYMVTGAVGAEEDGAPRMVTTPWFDHEIPMTQAAELGTKKVMEEHCSIGIVVTTDGSVTDIDRSDYIEAEGRAIKDMQATGKPFLVVINSRDPRSPKAAALKEQLKEQYGVDAAIADCQALTEEDIAGLDTYEDKQLFLEELGLEESGVNRLIKKAYHLLNLETFITAGEMEVKAWTYHKGWKAPQCAGVIHTDFEKGFIRAEVIKYDDYIQYGSEAAVREAGKLGIEGKEYVVQDGDIMHFRFNV